LGVEAVTGGDKYFVCQQIGSKARWEKGFFTADAAAELKSKAMQNQRQL